MTLVHVTKPLSAKHEALLDQYYDLRVAAFAREFGGGALYKAGPNEIDLLEDTSYYFLTDESGQLLAGMRLHHHPASSNRALWFEEHYPELKLTNFISGEDLAHHAYAERGGVVAKDGHGKNFYGNELLTECLKHIPRDYPDLSFTVGNTNALSFKSLMIASMRAEEPVWYIRHQHTQDPVLNVDLRLVFVPTNQHGSDLLKRNIGLQRGDARSYSHEEWKR